jgi:FkbM family methyltransferase
MHILERVHVLHRAWRMRLRHNRHEIEYILSRSLRGTTVADVGANRGVYSYWLHRAVGPTGHVVAFEPQPELARYLQDLKTTFHLDRLMIEQLALSSSAGDRELTRPRDHWGGASLGTPMIATAEADRIAVRTTTLDDYFGDSELRPLRFIKADIEGHEHECFLGGERILREDKPALLFECYDEKFGDIFPYLESLDYTGYFFLHGTLTPISELAQFRASIAKSHLNFVFVPRPV